MTEDDELKVLASIQEKLEGLDDEVRGRVLAYLVSRYGIVEAPGVKDTPVWGAMAQEPEFPDLPTLYSTANPQSGPERALVVGYWFQVHEKQQDLEGQRINDKLKGLGDGQKNITSTMSQLMNRKRALVMQAGKKKAATRQSRKKYRLTAAGVEAVKKMLAGEALAEE